MKISLKRLALGIASAGLLTIYGCGGGAASGGSTTTGGSTTPTTLTGIAATGAAFTDAIITVTDSRGAVVGTSAVIGADGAYTITLSSSAVAPLVLTASRTTADGAVESLVSVMPASSTTTATVNITPVTNLIASRLSSSGDPTKLAAELAAGTSIVNATTVAATVADVQTILAPILAATGTTATDPLSGTFATNGTGYDRLLDSIKVTITPASNTASNVEIGIKQQLVDGTAPTAIQFTSGTGQTAVASVPVIPAITPSSLIPSGTSALIAAHLAQLNACFARPTGSRVDNANPTGAAIASATSNNIIATECRDAFIQNAGTISFKSSGNQIGAISGKPFRGIFFNGGTGTVFSQGTYEFTRTNGDIVVGYKKKDALGNETFDTFALSLDTDGKLKQIGNQYAYPGGVSAYHQNRQFITLSQSAFSYYSTGYNLNVDDVTGGTGVGGSIFDHVTVTTPKGNILTLKPVSGYSFLSLVTPGSSPNGSGSSMVRLRSEYIDTNNTADPKIAETAALFFADRLVFTNANIATIAAQSVWKFEYYLATAPGVVNQTQYYKTRARALTIPELQTKGLATLASADITTIQAYAIGAGLASAGKLPIGGATSVPVTYLVPAGALPPTSLTIWGAYTAGSFTDSLTVGSTARSGSILCSLIPASGDTHCSGGLFAPTVMVHGLHLWARDPQGRDYATYYAMYSL